jgi:hypothetical protein
MKHHHRRRFLHLAAGAAALPAVSRVARPQAYPSRPVRVIVGFPLHQRVSCERLIQIERRDHAPAINRCSERCRDVPAAPLKSKEARGKIVHDAVNS